jgi:hypothetical protein
METQLSTSTERQLTDIIGLRSCGIFPKDKEPSIAIRAYLETLGLRITSLDFRASANGTASDATNAPAVHGFAEPPTLRNESGAGAGLDPR